MKRMAIIWLLALLPATAPISKAMEPLQSDLWSGEGFYSSHNRYNLLDVDRQRAHLIVSEFEGALDKLPFEGASMRWKYMHGDFMLHEQALTNIDFKLTGKNEIARIGISLPLWGDKVTLVTNSGLARHGDKTLPVYDSRLAARLFGFVDLDLHTGHTGEMFDLDGIFWGEPISVSFRTDRTVSGLSGRLEIFENVAVLAGYKDLEFDETESEPDQRFNSQIFGSAEYRHQGIILGKTDKAYLQLMFSDFKGAGRLDFYRNSTRFGQIAKFRGECKRWQFAAGLPRWSHNWYLALERLKGKAEFAGHVESWPFTDPLVNLLGLRRNFKGNAEVSLWRLSGRGKTAFIAGTELFATVDLYRVHPELRFVDWMPPFMIFGVDDMDRYSDKYERIDFGRARIRLTKMIGRFLIGYNISQLFPISVREENVSAADGDSGGDNSSSVNLSSDSSSRTDGGRNMRLWVKYNF